MTVKADGSVSNLSRKGRERGIRKLMSINLLKRLESSVNSFRLTLNRIKDFIEATINSIDSFDGTHADVDDFKFEGGLDFDEREDSVFIGGKKTKSTLPTWIISSGAVILPKTLKT